MTKKTPFCTKCGKHLDLINLIIIDNKNNEKNHIFACENERCANYGLLTTAGFIDLYADENEN